MRPRRDVSHGDVFRSLNLRRLVFPRFANIKQGECLPAFLQRLHLGWGNFKIHLYFPVETGLAPSPLAPTMISRACLAAWPDSRSLPAPKALQCLCVRRAHLQAERYAR